MPFLKKILFSTFLCCFTTFVGAQTISVNDTQTAAALAQLLTNNSSCVNVSGATVTGDTFTPGKNSYGSFDKNGSSFPFANGIVLSTGSTIHSKGPFVRSDGDKNNNWKGDADLDLALGIQSVNATSLEFDFTPQTNFISFNYLFASNEYQDDFPCRYSDGFAFLIKEKNATTYTNLAVIPGTTTPVSSYNIHPAISFALNGATKTCDPINESYFKGLNTTLSNPINFGGQTVEMIAQTKVTTGKTYHIKLVIADDAIPTFDSAVFLEAGSFSSKIDLGQDRLVTTKNPICFGDPFTIDIGSTGGSYEWFKDGSPISGETNPTITVTSAGTYSVEATLASGCIATGEIKIEYTPKIILNNTNLLKCDDNGNGTATFDLTTTQAIITNNNTSLTQIAYYETQTGSILSNLISNPKGYTKTSISDQTVYAKLTSTTYGCSETATITLKTVPSTLSSTIYSTVPIVNDFSRNGNSVELIPPSTGGPYEYSLNGTNYQDARLFGNLATGDYMAFIRDKSNCEYWTYTVTLLDYPRYFTPNGDPYNDFWTIKNLDLFPKATITIFDRYGKLLKQLGATDSWDGKYIGKELPSDDYWFTINLGDGKIINGHFSLKR